MKKTNQPKEKKMLTEIEKYEMKKNDLVNEIDVLFYDIENIEDQASWFRTILRQIEIKKLKAIKDVMKEETKKQKGTNENRKNKRKNKKRGNNDK